MSKQSLPLFEEHRQLLFGIAYRMLGTVMDAQDMVQDTYLRWQQAAPGEIRSPRAWLTTVITRLCINHLQLARVQRETYLGPWLPEPLVEKLLRPFMEAVRKGDMAALLATMAEDVVFVSDGGGKAHAVVQPIHGAGSIARLLINIARNKHGSKDEEFRPATINGLPGFVRFVEGQPRSVIAFGLNQGRIHALFAISNPDKLRHLSPDSVNSSG